MPTMTLCLAIAARPACELLQEIQRKATAAEIVVHAAQHERAAQPFAIRRDFVAGQPEHALNPRVLWGRGERAAPAARESRAQEAVAVGGRFPQVQAEQGLRFEFP